MRLGLGNSWRFGNCAWEEWSLGKERRSVEMWHHRVHPLSCCFSQGDSLDRSCNSRIPSLTWRFQINTRRQTHTAHIVSVFLNNHNLWLKTTLYANTSGYRVDYMQTLLYNLSTLGELHLTSYLKSYNQDILHTGVKVQYLVYVEHLKSRELPQNHVGIEKLCRVDG